MGVVFRAFHQSLGIPVAVKVLRAEEVELDPNLYQQLKSEARLLAQLNHPNVVRVWDFEDHPRHPYLVLDLIEGLSLLELIQQSGRLQLDRAVEIILQAAEGLAAALAIGVIHRDVKPANILLARNGTAKLADFGLAVVRTRELLANDTGPPSALAPAGTPAYMAPEQYFAPETVDHRADIYSLGATFYHALTGRVPFEGRSVREVLLKQSQEQLVPAHELVPGLPHRVTEVLKRMMAKDPEERYQNYTELLAAMTDMHMATVLAPPSVPGESKAGEAPGGSSRPRANLSSTGKGASPSALGDEPARAAGLDPQSTHVSRVVRLNPLKLLRDAIAAAKAGDKPGARSLLQRAVQLNPRSEVAWLWLAGLVETPAEAVACFEHVLAINPASDPALQAIAAARLQAGIAAAQQGDKEQARYYLTAVVQHNPASELGWLWMAGVAETSDEALCHLERVLALNPNNERARSGVDWHRSRLAAQEPTRQATAVVAVPAARKPRVLIVDDDPAICKLVAILLEKQGVEVVQAATGEAGLTAIEECGPAVVLLDVDLPGRNGYQICKAIKANPVTTDLPVVLLSSGDRFFNKLRGRMAGATEHFSTGFQLDQLVQFVKRCCQQRTLGWASGHGVKEG
jgi:serine/threonine protein kinase